jgi:hypothetical protein
VPSFQIRNEVLRDELIKFSYPFDERSELENDDVFIGTDLFLDAIFYLKESASLPIHISTVDGTFGSLEDIQFLFSDSAGRLVGRTGATFETETCNVLNENGVLTGVVVFHPLGLRRFIGQVTGRVFQLLPAVATFVPDICHVVRTPHLRYLAVDGTAVHGNVRIVARHGVKFDVAPEGELFLSIVGDPPTDENQLSVISINGVRNRSIWLATHPRLNLRIETEEGLIRFTKARDDTTS